MCRKFSLVKPRIQWLLTTYCGSSTPRNPRCRSPAYSPTVASITSTNETAFVCQRPTSRGRDKRDLPGSGARGSAVLRSCRPGFVATEVLECGLLGLTLLFLGAVNSGVSAGQRVPICSSQPE